MRTIRVVIAKPGLDGHDRGAKVVARALRDAGVEVIYTGLHQTPEQIVAAALQEDADAIGLSILSGAHMTQFARVLELLAERDATDITVFGGGIIPDADIAELERMASRPGVTSVGNRTVPVLAPGDRVTHDKFGLGTVVSADGYGDQAEAKIDFGGDYGIKHLVLRYAPLEKL